MPGRFLVALMLSAMPAVARPITRPSPAGAQGNGAIATVNGEAITYVEYNRAIATSMTYWRKQDPSRLTDPTKLQVLEQSTLEELINRTVLDQEAKRQKIEVSDRELDAAVKEVKAHFDTDDSGKTLTAAQAQDAFEAELKRQGLTPEQFRERLRREAIGRKLIRHDTTSAQTIGPYVESLKSRAEIVRRPLPPPPAPSAEDDSSEAKPTSAKAEKQWWEK